MAQYRYFHNDQLKVDPTTGTKCRTGQLNHQFVEQKFVGGVWVGIGDNDGVRYGDVAAVGCRFREGMRDGDYVVDVETEVAGFLLAEGDGWTNCGKVSSIWSDADVNAIYNRMVALGETPDAKQKKNLIDTITALKVADLYNGQFDLLTLPCNGRGSSKLNIINEYEVPTWNESIKLSTVAYSQSTIANMRQLSNGDILAATVAPSSSGHILRSVDNGLNWVDEGIPWNGEYAVYDFCDLGGGIVLVGGGIHAHISRSIDYGHTWTDLGPQFSYQYITFFKYLGNGIVIATTENSPAPKVTHMIRSTDYGLTWSDVGSDGTDMTVINMLCNLGNGIVIAGGGRDDGGGIFADGRIIRSIDYGATWTNLVVIIAGQCRMFGSAYCGNGVVVVGTSPSAYILRSTDYGATWAVIGRETSSKNIMQIFYLGNDVLIAGTQSIAGNGQILRSTNAGLTWENLGDLVAGQNSVLALLYVNNILLAGTVNASNVGASIMRSISNQFARKTTNSFDSIEVANTGTLTFVPNEGFKSDGVKSYLKSNFISPANQINKSYKYTDACFGFLIGGTISTAAVYRVMGAQNSNGSILTGLGKGSGGGACLYLNTNQMTGGQPIDLGYNLITRDIASYKQFINDNSYDIVGAVVMGSEIDREFFWLAFNNGAGVPINFVGSNVVLKVPFIGKSMTQAKFLQFQTIINNYIANL